MSRPLILASSSVYRQSLLQRLNLPFDAISPDVDETPRADETPKALAMRLAHAKAQAVAAQAPPDAVVIGADQVAEADGQCLGKPLTSDRAVEQLMLLSDKTVTFHSAMVVIAGEEVCEHHSPTRIKMRALSRDEAIRYVSIDEPLHCAGAFKSEALGIALTESYTSDDPTAIIGLPLIALAQTLRQLGLRIP